MRQITILVLIMVLGYGLSACAAGDVNEQFIAMDTVITLHSEDRQAKEAFAEAKKQVYALEALLSRTRADSEVSRLNQADGKPVEISAPLRYLLEAAESYRCVTDGAFDVTIAPVCDVWGFTTDVQQVPDPAVLEEKLALVGSEQIQLSGTSAALGDGQEIDLGGIAKGYVSDLMESLCAKYDLSSGAVSLGGNVYVKGTKKDGTPWKVGVQDPKQPDTGALLGMIELQDAYAVTSGGYQRYFEQDGMVYHHIIDPANGYPANRGLTSVTVVANADGRDGQDETPGMGTMCDALSTALFVMGEEKALDFWRSSDLSFELLLVTEDDRVLVTEGLEQCFIPSQEGAYTYETVS